MGEQLRELGKFNDLVDFFGGKGLHKEALQLLKQFGQAEEEDDRAPLLHGPDRTIAYLQTLDASNIELILEFAKWVLEASPVHAMEVFLADTEKAESLPRRRVLEFLQTVDRRLAIQYLEHVIHDLEDGSPEFHSKLAYLYVRHIQERSDQIDEKEEWKEKLLDFLKDSKQYKPETVLVHLSPDGKITLLHSLHTLTLPQILISMKREPSSLVVWDSTNVPWKSMSLRSKITTKPSLTVPLSTRQLHHLLKPKSWQRHPLRSTISSSSSTSPLHPLTSVKSGQPWPFCLVMELDWMHPKHLH